MQISIDNIITHILTYTLINLTNETWNKTFRRETIVRSISSLSLKNISMKKAKMATLQPSC